VRGVRFRGLSRWRGSFEVLVYFVDGLIDFFTLATFEGCYFPFFCRSDQLGREDRSVSC
jgi:hypothetical protein